MQEYYERVGDDKISTEHIKLPKEEEQSEIQKFYAGSSIFITGASGFLGKLLVEKLLRSCSDLSHIYIVMREKKGKTIEERFNDVFNNLIFDKLRLEQPHFNKKISFIYGDLEQSNMGISNTDLDSIRSKIDIVFHVAATVRFDEPLRKAATINVVSTKYLLDIAKTLPKLKAFVHVSTAYSNCIHSEIEEKFYDIPIAYDQLINICDSFDDSQLEAITPQLIGKWPNTYTFTKAIAENLLKTYGHDLPLTIVRPSIVLATVNEPTPGWIDNFAGAGGLSAGIGAGLIHSLYGKYNLVFDIVPADFTINTIIVAGWKRGSIKEDYLNKNASIDTKNLENIVPAENIPIYNNVSSAENPKTLGDFINIAMDYGTGIQTTFCLWYCYVFLFTNRYDYLVACFFTHLIPALLVDGVCFCIGKKPFLLKLYKKVYKMNDTLKYFTLNQWTFCNKNSQALWKSMSERDHRLFNFNMASLDWYTFICSFALGIRIYLFKDPMTTLKHGRARYFKIKIAHYCIMAILVIALLKLLTVIFHFVF